MIKKRTKKREKKNKEKKKKNIISAISFGHQVNFKGLRRQSSCVFCQSIAESLLSHFLCPQPWDARENHPAGLIPGYLDDVLGKQAFGLRGP